MAAKESNAQEPGKTLPPDIFSDVIPDTETLPLDGEVKEKSYGSIPDGAQAQETTPGDGASTAPSNGGDSAAPTADGQPAATAAEPAKTPEEIQSQAAQAVDLILKGYDKLHGLGRYMGKMDDSELTTLHAKGKINLNQELPLGKKSIRVGQFFEEYNQGIDENIVVSTEFKDAIRPALTRVAIRRGWTLSDELYCVLLASEDMATKISMLVGLKKSANLVLNACIEMTKTANQKGDNTKDPDAEYEFAPTEDAEWKEPAAAQEA